MKTASRIILYIFGAFAIVSIISSFIAYVIAGLVDLGFGIYYAFQVQNNTSEFIKMIGEEGVDPSTAQNALTAFLIFYFVISGISFIASGISMLIVDALLLGAAICAFVGAGKKPRKGAHIAAIVFAGLLFLLGGETIIAIGLIVGSIFGLITDKKLKEQEEAPAQENALVEVK